MNMDLQYLYHQLKVFGEGGSFPPPLPKKRLWIKHCRLSLWLRLVEQMFRVSICKKIWIYNTYSMAGSRYIYYYTCNIVHYA